MIVALVRGLAAARFYRRLMLLERRLDEPIVELPLPAGLTGRQLDLEDLPAYHALRPDQDPAVIRRRLADVSGPSQPGRGNGSSPSVGRRRDGPPSSISIGK